MLDEFAAGVPVLSAVEVRASLGLAYEGTSWLLLALPLLTALLIEAPLVLWAAQRPKTGVVMSLAAMGLCLGAAATTSSVVVTFVGLALWAPAGGVAASLSQAALMDAHPEAREKMMARWTLFGMVGDLISPVAVGLCASWGLGWKPIMLGIAIAYGGHAVFVAALPWPTARTHEDDEPQSGWWPHVRAGIGNPRLLLWLLGAAVCALLDETMVAFGTLYLQEDKGFAATHSSWIWTGCALGGAIGLVLIQHRVRDDNARVLLGVSCLVCVVAYVTWLWSESLWASVASMVVVGAATGPQYALAKAQAYASHQGSAVLVTAVDQLFVGIGVAVPILAGRLADSHGLEVALSLLLLQPIGLGILTLAVPRRGARPTPLAGREPADVG